MPNPESDSGPSEGSDGPEDQGPPSPPKAARHLRLRPLHAGLLFALFLIVAFAVAGFFGNARDTASAQSRSLQVSVDFPERFRYKEIAPLTVRLKNRRSRPIDTVSVRFDSTYIEAFSNVRFLPSATEPWVVGLHDVRPGETRRIKVHLQAERYGSNTGQIHALTDTDTTSATLQTFVFP